MFGTVILDAYKKGETIEISNAIEEICSPLDSYGWASAGIYCFWNYYTHEVLYIGLASDLSVRFKQHNGLLPIEDVACKRQSILDKGIMRSEKDLKFPMYNDLLTCGLHL